MLSIVLLVSLAFFGFKYGSCNDWNIIVLCAPVMKKNDEEYIVAEKYSGMEKFISQGSGTFFIFLQWFFRIALLCDLFCG